MEENPLVVNRIKTPDGTILQSKYRHDFQKHDDKNGETYILDGGIDYIKSSINKVPAENLNLYLNDNFEEIRKFYFINSLADNYLYKISDDVLNTLNNIKLSNKILEILIKKELIYRFNNNIKI